MGARENGDGKYQQKESEPRCPICSETFPLDIIERHASRCAEEVYV